MRRFLLTLCLCLAPVVAGATTWTCTKDTSMVLGGPTTAGYLTVGNCTASGNYTTGGGDALGTAATASATAAAVCQNSLQTLVRLFVTAASSASTTGTAVAWDPGNFKLQVFTSAGAAPAFLAESTSQALPTGFSINFLAVCK